MCAVLAHLLYVFRKLNPAIGTVEVTAKSKATSMEHHLWVAKASSESSVVSGIIGVKRWKIVDPDASSSTDRFEIVHFCVGGETRRQGIGSALLSEALQYCRREGASVASLTVLSSFIDARYISLWLSPSCVFLMFIFCGNGM